MAKASESFAAIKSNDNFSQKLKGSEFAIANMFCLYMTSQFLRMISLSSIAFLSKGRNSLSIN